MEAEDREITYHKKPMQTMSRLTQTILKISSALLNMVRKRIPLQNRGCLPFQEIKRKKMPRSDLNSGLHKPRLTLARSDQSSIELQSNSMKAILYFR